MSRPRLNDSDEALLLADPELAKMFEDADDADVDADDLGHEEDELAQLAGEALKGRFQR